MPLLANQSVKSLSGIQQILATVGDLPSSPGVIKVVMDRTADFNTDIKGLSDALTADQGISAKVLKLSNSSFYGRAHNVATLEEAIIILGFYTLRSMVVATATRDMFTENDPKCFQAKLWEHSLACAMACRMLSIRTGLANPDEAFLAGLMHDLGKLVFLQKMKGKYEPLLRETRVSAAELCVREREIFGFDHTDLGTALMESWSFPTELVGAIRNHHNPSGWGSDESSNLACLTNLADSITHSQNVCPGQPNSEQPWEIESAGLLELDQITLEEISAELKTNFESEKSRFEG